jgi:hypothetical protein
MSNTPARNVTQTTELHDCIGAQVATGHDADGLVRAGLRPLIARDPSLRATSLARPVLKGERAHG